MSSNNTKKIVEKQKKKRAQRRKQVKKNETRESQLKGVRDRADRRAAIAANNKVTPVTALVMAPGVKSTIKIKVIIDSQSVKLVPTGLLSLSAMRGLPAGTWFSVYKLMLSDVSSLFLSGTGTAPSRFRFQNDIFGSFCPKNIPYRPGTTIEYSVDPFDATPANSIGIHGGKTYYMWWTPPSQIQLAYTPQSAPPATTDVDDRSNYTEFTTALAGHLPHNKVIRDINLTQQYLQDGSAFTRVSLYYGEGGGVGGPYGSTELEVPFKSNMLGTFIKFDNATPRASRVLDKMSGDACSNYAIGVLDCFPTHFYNGAVPPIYKFLDIAEVAALMVFTLQQAINVYYTNSGPAPANQILEVGFTFSYQTFLLMLRQQLLYMFSDSQCLGQFQTFDTNNVAFQAFLCGSNCHPKEPNTKIRITTVLNENLKMLKMIVRPYETKNFSSSRNHITHIPVWGAYLEYQDPGFRYFNRNGVDTPVFAGTELGPDLWDGTMGNDVIDLNFSTAISEAAEEWNDWMIILENMFSSLDTIGGDSNGSPLLQFTRYVAYNPLDKEGNIKKTEERVLGPKERVPQAYKHLVQERTKVLERVNSKSKKDEIIERVLVIPDSTVYVEFTRSYSGLAPITSTHKEFLADLILPIIDVSSFDGVPSTSQIESACLEGYNMYKFDKDSTFASRADELSSSTIHHVVGIAGRKSSLAQFIDALAKNNQGAFFGDLFSFVGNTANALGFSGVGGVASAAGRIANTLNV